MESEEDSIEILNEDDANAEDDLPDLVLDTTRKESTSSLEGGAGNNVDSTSSSVIDLLLSMTKGRRSVSSSDIAQWVVDAGDDEIDQFDKEEVSAYLAKSSRWRPDLVTKLADMALRAFSHLVFDSLEENNIPE